MISTSNSTSDSTLYRIYGRVRSVAEGALLGSALKTKALRGGAWMSAGSIAEQAARFGRNMILARLLAPNAFGTMAIALSAATVVDTLTDVGVATAVITNPRGAEAKYLNTAWWLAVGRGAFIYCLVFSIAPWVSRFYGNPELLPLLRVILFGVLFSSAMSSGAILAIKQMKFNKWATINNGGAIFGVLLTVVLSFFIRDVWALAIGFCAESFGRCILSHILCPFLPTLPLDKEAAKDLLKFSRGIFGLGFLNLIFSRTDIFVLGKLYPAAQLGLYSMAIYMVQTPMSFIMNLQGLTLTSTFSRIQEDNARVNRILLQTTSLLVLLGMPVVVFVLFFGRSVLTIAYGHRYAAAAAPLMVAGGVALINLLNAQLTTVFYAKSRPHLHRVCVIITATTMIVLIYPFTKTFGLVGGQWACLIAISLGFLFQLIRFHGFTELNLAEYGKILLQGVGFSLIVSAICLGTRSYPVLTRPIPSILVGMAACVLAYGFGAGFFLWGAQKKTASS